MVVLSLQGNSGPAEQVSATGRKEFLLKKAKKGQIPIPYTAKEESSCVRKEKKTMVLWQEGQCWQGDSENSGLGDSENPRQGEPCV